MIKLTCKKKIKMWNDNRLKVGKEYTAIELAKLSDNERIYEIDTISDSYSFDRYITFTDTPKSNSLFGLYLWDYFYTIEELRKKKIETFLDTK